MQHAIASLVKREVARRSRDGGIVPAEKEKKIPFQQVSLLRVSYRSKQGKYLYFPNEVADANEVTRFAR